MSENLAPTLLNQTCTLADTEYSISIPGGCKHFSLQCRTAFAIRFAFVTGKVATSVAPFATIKSGGAYTSPEKLSIPATTLYVASSEAGVIVELVVWG